jgi:Protein of unknown function (DUF2939)
MSRQSVLSLLRNAGAMTMRVRWPVLATVMAMSMAYIAVPYLTLYRVGSAIRSGDAKTLEALVDWSSVREGIKEDICDLVVDDPSTQSTETLPPFGASFMRGIAANKIDQAVTPQALVAATHASATSGKPAPEPDPGLRGADVHVNWAFFDSATSFQISLRAPGQTDPIRLEMELSHWHWQIDRVWLPAELLTGQGGART